METNFSRVPLDVFCNENNLDDGGMQTQKAKYIDSYVYVMHVIYTFIVGNSVFKSVQSAQSDSVATNSDDSDPPPDSDPQRQKKLSIIRENDDEFTQ